MVTVHFHLWDVSWIETYKVNQLDPDRCPKYALRDVVKSMIGALKLK